MKPSRVKKTQLPELKGEPAAQPTPEATPNAASRPVNELLHELQVQQIELETQNEALRQSQIAIEKSRDRYADLYEFAPVAYITLENNGLITQINIAGAELLGVDRSKLISRRFADFVAAEDQDRWHTEFSTALRSPNGFANEFLLKRSDASVFRGLANCRWTAIGIEAGSMLLTVSDIGERRSLEKREQSFNAVFELSPIGIAVVGPDQRYRQVNPAFCRMLGYSEKELLELTYLDVTHPNDRELHNGNVELLVTGDVEHFSIEKRYLRKTGESLWVSLNVVAVKKEGSGELIYSIGLAEDITARREAEALRLSTIREQRNTLVREVHHRIKNNLQSVAGLLQRELGQIAEVNPRLKAAISQVNAIAVVHGLQGSNSDEAIRLCDSVRNICKTVAELTLHPVLFHIEHEETGFKPVQIASNEAVPIALVLNELILNAVKHSPESGTVTKVSLSADGTSARLLIRNARRGIAEFNFDTGQGLGTGLRLVRSLMPAQGAKLSFEADAEGLMLTHLKLMFPVVVTPGHLP